MTFSEVLFFRLVEPFLLLLLRGASSVLRYFGGSEATVKLDRAIKNRYKDREDEAEFYRRRRETGH